MPISKQVIGVKGDECQCGRRATIRHCPSCGSTRSYARMNKYHEFADGSIKKVDNEFRCQSCGHLYIDEERALCEAPPVGQTLASQRVRAIYEAQQQGEYLSPKEAKIANALKSLVDASPEQRKEIEEKVERLLKGAWADAVFAHKSGKGENPGDCNDFVAKHKEDAIRQFVERQP